MRIGGGFLNCLKQSFFTVTLKGNFANSDRFSRPMTLKRNHPSCPGSQLLGGIVYLVEYFVYILKNEKGRFYIGHTDNLIRRYYEHSDSSGRSHLGKYTHKNGPWTLVWWEIQSDRSSAMRREKQIKNWKSAKAIRKLFEI